MCICVPQVWLYNRRLAGGFKVDSRDDMPCVKCNNRWPFYRTTRPNHMTFETGSDIRTTCMGLWWYQLWHTLHTDAFIVV